MPGSFCLRRYDGAGVFRLKKLRFQGPALLVWTSKCKPRELQWPRFPEFGAADLSFWVLIGNSRGEGSSPSTAADNWHLCLCSEPPADLRSPLNVAIHQKHHTGCHHVGEVTWTRQLLNLNPKPLSPAISSQIWHLSTPNSDAVSEHANFIAAVASAMIRQWWLFLFGESPT